MDREIACGVGTEFEITVEENPTTGYTWEADYEGDCLCLDRREFNRTSTAIGSGGTARFVFVPLATGRTMITLKLRRPWEDEAVRTIMFEVEAVRPLL